MAIAAQLCRLADPASERNSDSGFRGASLDQDSRKALQWE